MLEGISDTAQPFKLISRHFSLTRFDDTPLNPAQIWCLFCFFIPNKTSVKNKGGSVGPELLQRAGPGSGYVGAGGENAG